MLACSLSRAIYAGSELNFDLHLHACLPWAHRVPLSPLQSAGRAGERLLVLSYESPTHFGQGACAPSQHPPSASTECEMDSHPAYLSCLETVDPSV